MCIAYNFGNFHHLDEIHVRRYLGNNWLLQPYLSRMMFKIIFIILLLFVNPDLHEIVTIVFKHQVVTFQLVCLCCHGNLVIDLQKKTIVKRQMLANTPVRQIVP